MKYKTTNIERTIILRLEKGEDLFESLIFIAEKEGIKGASFNAIGAVSKARVAGFEYNDDGQIERKWNEFEGHLEIASCSGNICLKEGKPEIHAHIVLADHQANILAGHFEKGLIIDPTAEIFIQIYKDSIEKIYDQNSGLWLMLQ